MMLMLILFFCFCVILINTTTFPVAEVIPGRKRDMFAKLLQGSHISRVSSEIFRLLEDKFAVRFDNVYQSGDPDAAYDLYQAAKDYPNKTTAAAFQQQFNISVIGPFAHSESARIFQANRTTGSGELLVIKVPFQSESQKPDEVKVCEALSSILEAPKEAFVPTAVDLVDVRSADDASVYGRRGKFYALVMPHFAGMLVEPLRKYSEATVFDNALRIVGAVECLHAHEYVHMDIKGANIFLDRHGSWYVLLFSVSVVLCLEFRPPIYITIITITGTSVTSARASRFPNQSLPTPSGSTRSALAWE
jgi:serine/threonine protein kinase